MREESPRDRLLDSVIEHFAQDGLGDQSLRRIADAVGSSHRMLLYHFGSKDGLLVAVAREVEARTRVRLATLATASGGATDELIRRVWAYVADPGLADLERLFFALYSRAIQGDPALGPLLEGDITGWLDTTATLAAASGIGVPTHVARIHARLAIAVVRGLLLDLLATGEQAEVGAALDAFARFYAGGRWEETGAGSVEQGATSPGQTPRVPPA
jgi:AcrR family transcriptional regulator